MRLLRAWGMRLAGLFSARRRARQFDAEIQGHLELQIDDNIRQGMAPEEARRRALAESGGLQAAREAYRDRGGVPLVETLAQDVRFAVRMLRKAPGFTAASVLILALGIGANGALFSLINALLLRSMVPGAGELVGLYSGSTVRPDAFRGFSYPEYIDIRGRNDVFETLVAESPRRVGITENGVTRRAAGMFVSSNYFPGLGVRLAAGRNFTAAEERPGSGAAVVIVSHDHWRRRGLTPDLVGQLLIVNGRPFTIAGVAPPAFYGTTPVMSTDIWLPFGAVDGIAEDRGLPSLLLYGTLEPGVSTPEAEARLAPLASSLAAAYPEFNRDQKLVVHARSRTGRGPQPSRSAQPAVAATGLMAIGGLVLIVACLNLANLLLARGSARRQEIGVRLALGGGRVRIVRQLLVEGLLLSAMGGAAALVIGWWSANRVLATIATVLSAPVNLDVAPDGRVVAAISVACVVSTLLFALGPAWKLTRADLVSVLKPAVPIGIVRGRRTRTPGLLVGVQVALSLALLVAAGAFVRAGANAAAADPGFPLEGGVLVETDAGLAQLDEAQGRAAYRRVLERLRSMPEVRAASAASIVPLGPNRPGRLIRRATDTAGATDTAVATFTIAGADYFATLGLPVLDGREFTAAEEQSSSADRVAIIDETLAQRLFSSGTAVGQVVRVVAADESTDVPVRIVGVVPTVRDDITEPPFPHLYVPLGQQYQAEMTFHARTAPGGEAALLAAVGDAVRDADERLPIVSVKTLAAHRDASQALWAIVLAGRIFGAFGTIALVLATAGVYGLRAYLVAQRTRELGIRMALGATRGRVINQLLRDGAGVAVAGMAAGLLLAFGLIQVLRQSEMLYEVRTFDPVILAAASLVLAAAVAAASYVPTRRAVRVDPAVALRPE